MPIKLNVISLLILFLFLSNTGFAQTLPSRPNQIDINGKKQGDWVYYYDADWNIQKDSIKAQFYRLIRYEDSRPIGRVLDYYSSGQIQMSVDSMVKEDPEQFDGNLSLYSEEGNITLVEYFHNGQMDTVQTINIFIGLIQKYQKQIPDHLDLAYTANNLAYLHRERQQYDSAEIYYRLAKEIREKQLGPNHVLYANSCNKLGYVLMKQGKLEQAEPMYMISKRVHGQTLGIDSDYHKNANGNLAYIYMETGRYELAEPLYKETVDIQLKTKGKEDESYRYNCYQLARVYARLNDPKKALEFYLNAKNITEISKEHLLWFEELMEE